MQTYKGKNVLVTGGAGAIGANITNALVGFGAHVVIVDNFSSGCKENVVDVPNIRFVQGDITDRNVLDDVFDDGIDIVLHLAAFFANQNSVDHPRLDAKTNILGTIGLLEKSKESDVSLFLYANTSCMYDHSGLDWTEDSKDFHYDTPYSISKHTGEQYAEWYCKYHSLPAVSVRIFNSYGPHEYPGKYRNVIPNFFNTALKGESLTITGTGDETRSFTYIDDTVRGILLAGARHDGVWKVYNIGSDKETKIIDLAEKINALVGNTAPIIFAKRRSWDKASRRKPSIELAREQLGFDPVTSLDEGLQKTLEWFKSIEKV